MNCRIRSQDDVTEHSSCSSCVRASVRNLSGTEICRQLAEYKAETYMLIDNYSLTGSSHPTIVFFRFHA